MPKSYFEQFDVVVGDEAHLFKAKSLTSIMTKLISCKYRFGLTGTLDGAQTHKLVLEGLFGPVKQVVKTKELIDSKQLADFKIKAIVLKHSSEDCKALKDAKYQDEVDWIVRNEERNKFLANLALSLKGNTLMLFQFVEKHGKVLEEMIRSRAEEGRKIFYVHGGTDADTREGVRAITEKENDAIIVVLGLTLSACTTSSLPAQPKVESEPSSPSVEDSVKEVETKKKVSKPNNKLRSLILQMILRGKPEQTTR